MSRNDLYRIIEVRRGVFDVFHMDVDMDVEGLPRRVVKLGCRGIRAAVKVAEVDPAEYGYHIEFLE